MYKRVIRPLLFELSPEVIHRIAVVTLRVVHYIPGARIVLRACFSMRHPSLEREVFGLRFPNPVGLAAGFDKDAEVYKEMHSLGFGFTEIGTVTPKPQPGNPRPRLFRLPEDQALINRMGFNNQGVRNAVHNLRHRSSHHIIGGNLGKNTATPNEMAAADYLQLFRSLYEYVDYFVINVSCPNVAKLTALQDKANLNEILRGLIEFRRGQNQYRPILLKISPDLTTEQVDTMIDVLMESGLDGIVAANTTVRRDGLKTPASEVEAIGNGGLSGSPLTQRSLEMVRYIYQKTEGRFPIIGVGGIMTEEDALAMLKAGASLIQVYTGFIYNGPKFVKRICKRIRQDAALNPQPSTHKSNA
ncbi:MAG: quinone-dependent dihydroorotate dehydrogenase [Alistipes sp.]|nr:quinone-dependent dihydroorotate dehydrogenase [Alistipes sp.]